MALSTALMTSVVSCFESIDQPTIRRLLGVEDGGAVDPAFARAVLRDVRDPEFVRSGAGELPVHEIIGRDHAS